ncbi:hypothetical protein [Streptomyces ochraceiscleroticus]|uniref:Uncharacterized protein n=1 Tax=Streptomyces ochraceiscleroticus TaxID=47761 RepID=A0ABW1MNY7_9ACTN|nr:hypothetical protein [Streptomyces ochraceiscleroticus]
MDTGITIAVILAMVVLGALLIHRLNGQQAGRMAAHPHGHRPHGHRGLPRLRRPHGSTQPPPPGSHP